MRHVLRRLHTTQNGDGCGDDDGGGGGAGDDGDGDDDVGDDDDADDGVKGYRKHTRGPSHQKHPQNRS